jgi:hypothetical protein
MLCEACSRTAALCTSRFLAVQAEAPARQPPARPVPQLGDTFHCGACSMGPVARTILTPDRSACAKHVCMSPCCSGSATCWCAPAWRPLALASSHHLACAVTKEAACLLLRTHIAPARLCELIGCGAVRCTVCASARARGVPSQVLKPWTRPLPGQPWWVGSGQQDAITPSCTLPYIPGPVPPADAGARCARSRLLRRPRSRRGLRGQPVRACAVPGRCPVGRARRHPVRAALGRRPAPRTEASMCPTCHCWCLERSSVLDDGQQQKELFLGLLMEEYLGL